jgi:hypothetical protein
MENHISESLMKLASSIDSLAESIEKEPTYNPQIKTAGTKRDFGFGSVDDTPDRGADPLMAFLLS